jgi:hypothetical protein
MQPHTAEPMLTDKAYAKILNTLPGLPDSDFANPDYKTIAPIYSTLIEQGIHKVVFTFTHNGGRLSKTVAYFTTSKKEVSFSGLSAPEIDLLIRHAGIKARQLSDCKTGMLIDELKHDTDIYNPRSWIKYPIQENGDNFPLSLII